MSLTDEQAEKLTLWMGAIAEARIKLNDWERGFFGDQEKRYDEYKENIRLSPKQWACLENMYKKVTE